MTVTTIRKGDRVRVIATGQTGVIVAQRPDTEPYGSTPLRGYRAPERFQVYDFDTRTNHGWHDADGLERYSRGPADTPEHIRRAAERGTALLLAHRKGAS